MTIECVGMQKQKLVIGEERSRGRRFQVASDHYEGFLGSSVECAQLRDLSWLRSVASVWLK